MVKSLPKSWSLRKLGEYVEKQKGKKPKHLSPVLTTKFTIPYVDIKAFEKNIIQQIGRIIRRSRINLVRQPADWTKTR